MTVEDRSIVNYLPASTHQEIAVRDQGGSLVFRINCREAIRLVDKGWVDATVSRNGALRFLRLKVSEQRARRLLGKPRFSLCAEDNRTVFKVNTPTGILYQHNLARSFAYASPRHRQ